MLCGRIGDSGGVKLVKANIQNFVSNEKLLCMEISDFRSLYRMGDVVFSYCTLCALRT